MRDSPYQRKRFATALIFLCLAFATGCVFLAGVTRPDTTPGTRVVARFAVFGDGEPKPSPSFVYLERAVDAVSTLNKRLRIDFVASVGDIAHQGKVEQYEAATAEIRRLDVPFLGIMGNEEFDGGVERFLYYASQWNDMNSLIPAPSYVYEAGGFRFVFATASQGGRNFTDTDIDWIVQVLDSDGGQPAILFTHLPAPDIFPDAASDRVIQSERFQEILAHPTLVAVFSGHLHLNINTTTYVATSGDVHHISVPGLERTKVRRSNHMNPSSTL